MGGKRGEGLFTAYTVGLYAPLYWPYMFEYVTAVRGLSAGDFGLLKSVYSITVVALDVPCGMLADRLGRRTTLVVGAAFNGLACLGYAFFDTLPPLLATEVLMGMGTAMHMGADSALLFDGLREQGREAEYARAAGRARSAALAFGTVGLVLCDVHLARGGTIADTYVATAVLSSFSVLAALLMTEPTRREPTTRRDVSSLQSIRALGRIPAIPALMMASTAGYLLVRAGNGAFLGPILGQRGIEPHLYGTVYAGMALLGAVAASNAHRATKSVPSATLLRGSVASLLLAYLGFAAIPDLSGIAGLALVGIVAGLLTVVAQAALNEQVTDSTHRATALSLQSACWRGSYALAIPAAGWTIELWSLEAAITLQATLAALLLLASALYRHRPRQEA